MKNIDLNKYQEFVDAVTSNESKSNNDFSNRWNTLQNERTADMPRLLTACLGLSAEAGEFTEVIKKIVFQGKPLDEDNIWHMQRELGDVMWYWMQAVHALNITANEVIEENIRKLEARYPGGFEATRSENRQEGDI